MTYESWRISYQSSEQAARAAYAECARLCARLEAAEKERDDRCIHPSGPHPQNEFCAWRTPKTKGAI